MFFDCWRWDIWTTRDQRPPSAAVFPARWSNLCFREKRNWAWPQHRRAQEYKLMNQRPLQDQTQPEKHSKWKNKKMEGLGKQRYLHILPPGYQRATLQCHPGHRVQQVERAFVSKQDVSFSKGTIWGSALAWPTKDCYQPSVHVIHDYPWDEESGQMKINTALASF